MEHSQIYNTRYKPFRKFCQRIILFFCLNGNGVKVAVVHDSRAQFLSGSNKLAQLKQILMLSTTEITMASVKLGKHIQVLRELLLSDRW